MASTFTATTARSTASAYGHGLASNAKAVIGTYEITAALVINDVFQMVKVPTGAVILDVTLWTDDLESSGTASVLAVGDGGAAARFITTSAVGQAGGRQAMNVINGVGYAYTVEDTIDVSVTTAPTTGATSGTITLVVIYQMP
jgi:hypothetical protein